MDVIEERKISKADKALFIAQMLETPGWKVLDTWLQTQLVNSREQLEETLSEEFKGRVRMLKEIYVQIKEYTNGK